MGKRVTRGYPPSAQTRHESGWRRFVAWYALGYDFFVYPVGAMAGILLVATALVIESPVKWVVGTVVCWALFSMVPVGAYLNGKVSRLRLVVVLVFNAAVNTALWTVASRRWPRL